MSDRLVRQIDPRPNDEIVAAKRMSDYDRAPNIILIGDPGAGKSHLFDELALAAKTTVQRARAFLNTPTEFMGTTLFIDALDERRAGRTDQDTVDLIVKKLFEIRPERVRLACREHDWLGETDVASFHSYFATSGGYFVLALEPLTVTEQRHVLRKVGVTDPDQFIKDANGRALSEFLTNPQNLIMLAEVVLKKGSWPTNRQELLEEATDILLKEHNRDRVRSGGGQFSAKELRAPAGAVSAVRLISDVDGISLAESELDPLYPSYRTIPFAEPDRILASLGRRAFRGLGNEAVDYSHRVTAEYLAANWIAQKVRSGLPLSRVQALVGIDGVPAPELRGLHAWLAALLPERADEIIDADPLGILIHSSPDSFDLSLRIRLLDALSNLASEDPYFRPEDRSLSAISALCSSDMAPHLRSILKSPKAPFGIKKLVLEALGSARPLPSLQEDIAEVLIDSGAPFGLKTPALAALVRLGPAATDGIVQIYRTLGSSADDIRLRANILAAVYVGHFTGTDVSNLYNAAVHCDEELVGGALWPVSQSIPTHDVPLVLDEIIKGIEPTREPGIRNRIEIEHFIQRLVIRTLEEAAEGISGARLWTWLQSRNAIRGEYYNREFEGIKPLFAERPLMAREVFDAAVDTLGTDSVSWRFSRALLDFLPYPLSGEPVRWLTDRLTIGFANSEIRNALYELAFQWAYGNPEDNIEVFESLFALADSTSSLRPTRDRMVAQEIESWRAKDHRREFKEVEKRKAGRLKNLEQFTTDIQMIAEGTHRGWMTWTAEVYFGHFRDVDETLSPRARLEEELGSEYTAVALAGLKAFVRTERFPSLQELAEAESKNSYPRVWNALLAGMDELWLERPSVADFSDEALKVLVGIDLLLPTMSQRRDGVWARDEHTWKDHIVSTRSDFVKDVYLFLIEESLKCGGDHRSGLYEILNVDLFEQFRDDVAAHLLTSYPNQPPQRLEELLQIALPANRKSFLKDLASRTIADTTLVGDEQRQIWMVAAYLLSPEVYQDTLEEYVRRAPSIVWRMRALTSYDRDTRKKPVFELEPPQREFLARMVASHFPNAPYPTGGWSGDENPWDAADYVRSLLSALSADKSAEATDTLERLLRDPTMTTYADSIRHALANQRTRYRELSYNVPQWSNTIRTLSGGAPANVADLQALMIDHLKEISSRIGTQNIDVYKQFWNEDHYGRPTNPKIEESARDVLLGLLKTRLDPLGIITEPEGHMVTDKRADITAMIPGIKLIIELKRDVHPELWSAPATQLDRFYTRDPEASGYGVFGVFWYGNHGAVPQHPTCQVSPKTALELEQMINDTILGEQRSKLRAVVIDVSIPDGQRVSPAVQRAKGTA